MAAHHQPTTRSRQEAGPVSESDGDTPATDGDEPAPVTTVERASRSDSDEIAAAIERERLRARLRALERELVASERRHQALVYRYEQRLSERSSDDSAESSPTRRARLKAFLVPGQ